MDSLWRDLGAYLTRLLWRWVLLLFLVLDAVGVIATGFVGKDVRLSLLLFWSIAFVGLHVASFQVFREVWRQIPRDLVTNVRADLNASDPATRKQAVDTLRSAMKTDADARNALVVALNHPDPNVKMYSALALAPTRDLRTVAVLGEAVSTSEQPEIRREAATALHNLCRDIPIQHRGDVAQKISKALVSESEPDIGKALISALAALGDEKAAPALRGALDWPEVSAEAAKALGQIRDAQAVPQLLTKLDDPHDPLLRQAAVEALVKIGDPSVSGLIQRLDRSETSSAEVRDTLVQIPSALPALLEALQAESTDTARNAARVLAARRDSQAVPGLIKALHHRDRVVADTVAPALRHQRDAVPELLELLRGQDLRLKELAATALDGTKDEQVTDALIHLLESETNESVRIAAVYSLASIGSEEAIRAIIRASQNDNVPPFTVRNAVTDAFNRANRDRETLGTDDQGVR